METKKCPKCEERMEEGAIPDYSYYSQRNNEIWEKKFSNPLIRKVKNAEEIIDKEMSETGFNIVVYRCKSCGFLESYAK